MHLHEIGRLESLLTVAPLIFPNRVWEELRRRTLDRTALHEAGVESSVADIEALEWKVLLAGPEPARLQPADAQVFFLAQVGLFQALVLTDDLALRRRLEAHGATVVGSVGILIRAYASGRFPRHELEQSVETLLEESSLHLSRAFRVYVRKLVSELP